MSHNAKPKDNSVVGQNIKRLRKQRHLTQKELAKSLGVAEITIRQYENNNRTPTLSILYQIADALQVDIRELLFTESDAEKNIYLGSLSVYGLDVIFREAFISSGFLSAEDRDVQIDFAKDFFSHPVDFSHPFDLPLNPSSELDSDIDIDLRITRDVSEDEFSLLEIFAKLNQVGKSEAIKRVSELTEIARYTTKDGE